MRLAALALVVLVAGSGEGWATMPTLSQLPKPATTQACQVWAEKQDEDALDMWGTEEDGKSSPSVAISRLVSVCLGGETPEIVGFHSSVGAASSYCARHPGIKLCAEIGGDSATNSMTCLVNDPTPTPLNYRTAPYGKILGSFGNGAHVSVLDETRDQHGKPWAYVSDDEGRPLGWVYRSYIDCR